MNAIQITTEKARRWLREYSIGEMLPKDKSKRLAEAWEENHPNWKRTSENWTGEIYIGEHSRISTNRRFMLKKSKGKDTPISHKFVSPVNRNKRLRHLINPQLKTFRNLPENRGLRTAGHDVDHHKPTLKELIKQFLRTGHYEDQDFYHGSFESRKWQAFHQKYAILLFLDRKENQGEKQQSDNARIRSGGEWTLTKSELRKWKEWRE